MKKEANNPQQEQKIVVSDTKLSNSLEATKKGEVSYQQPNLSTEDIALDNAPKKKIKGQETILKLP